MNNITFKPYTDERKIFQTDTGDFNFAFSTFNGNCGALLCYAVYRARLLSLYDLSRKRVIEIFLSVLLVATKELSLSNRSVLVFSDINGGLIDWIFKTYFPDIKWTDESTMGINENSGHILIFRHLHKHYLEAELKKEIVEENKLKAPVVS